MLWDQQITLGTSGINAMQFLSQKWLCMLQIQRKSCQLWCTDTKTFSRKEKLSKICQFPFDISLILHRVSTLSMGKKLFSSSTEAYFNHAVITARDWFVLDKKTNQCTAVASEPIARQNGRGVWLYKQLPATASQISSLQQRTPFFADSSLMAGSAVETPQAAGLGPLAATSFQTRSSPAAIQASIQRASQKSKFHGVVANATPSCTSPARGDLHVFPACGWHSRRVCVMLGEIPGWCYAQWDWLLSLREFQSCISALKDSFLFRERLRSSCPPLFFLPGTCEKKKAGQRIWAAGDKRAHVCSMPTCLAITTKRAFTCPLHPAWSASLCGCERHDLVRCEWQWTAWPLAVICFTQCQTQCGWRAHPRYD